MLTLYRRLSPRQKGFFYATLGALLFSIKAILIKAAYQFAVDPITLLMYRMIFAAPFFMVMVYLSERKQIRLPLRDYGALIGLGFLGYYLASTLDFAGLQFISAGLERLILYLNPTLIILLQFLIYRITVSWQQLQAMILSYLGVVIALNVEFNHTDAPILLGAGLIFLSALTYALYLVLAQTRIHKIGPMRFTGYAGLAASFFCIAQFFVLRPIGAAQVAPEVIVLSLLNGVLCTALPIWWILKAVNHIGAARTAHIGMIGPIATLALGVWLLNEAFSPMLAVGTGLVLLGIYWMIRAAKVATQ